jgi:pimeloyl-ACP methyl ester carboxylesterase
MRRSLLLLATVAAMAAVLAPAAPGHATDNSLTPTWGTCPPTPPGVLRHPRQECATLRVPLDYRNPGGRAIDIAISRIPTAKPGLRRGILVSNPGGPGGQGLDLPSLLAAVMPAEVLDRFDLIGFDQRGVGYSTPVTCGLSPDTPPHMIVPYPAPDGSIKDNVEFAHDTAQACAAHSGDLLPYITTANTARDMDRIRVALGEPKLSYYGASYGTYLGAVYTSLFPKRSDRIVLDSAVDPQRVWYEQFRSAGPGFELRFPDFTAWVAARDDIYHLGATSEEVRRAYFRLAAELDRDPLTAPDGLVITGNLFRRGTHSALYRDAFFPVLAAFWQYAETRGATPLPPFPLPPPPPPNVPADNGIAALYAVTCDDVAWPRHVPTYAINVAIGRLLFPVSSGTPSNIWPCAFWPYRPVEPPVAVTGRGPRNVLILQNQRDPVTPWITGAGLRLALGGRAAMVSIDAGGHGVYPDTPGSCAYNRANVFLASGELPTHDTACPGPSPDAQTSSVANQTLFPPPGALGGR